MTLNYILLQAATDDGGWLSQLLIFGGIALVFYFFMIRPQQKKQKEQRTFIEGVKKGDFVVTIGGLHGKVTDVEGDTILLEVDRGVRIKIEKSSVSMDATKRVAKK
ncbi:preprotein translocase subunit YajC [Cytophagales bacterium RKSG123]|nr:preprotein translocase subunit YajC [Xanthovirga aplysinae]